MVESRWLRWFGPGLVALSAVGLVASTTAGAAPRPWTPRSCLGPIGDSFASTRKATPLVPADLASTPWYRLDPVAAADGALRGQRLFFGRFGDPVVRQLDLPAESFAAGPFGRIVLVGADDGTTSRLDAFDVATGCSWTLGTERDVVRRATVDPSGSAVFEMRVDRVTRADLGIWRRPIDASAPPHRVLAPIAPDARFGRTFSTEFTWDLAGDRLAIQSCGEMACRTRLLSPDGEVAEMIDPPDLGLLVGVDGDRVVTYAACRGFPCPIVETDAATGDRRVLAGDAWGATLVAAPDGARLVHEMRGGPGGHLRSVPLAGGGPTDVLPVADDSRLAGTPVAGGTTTVLPPGWVLLTPDGRLPVDPTEDRLQLRHIPDGDAVQLDEAVR